jgi:hypothetical protein
LTADLATGLGKRAQADRLKPGANFTSIAVAGKARPMKILDR